MLLNEKKFIWNKSQEMQIPKREKRELINLVNFHVIHDK